MKVSQLQISRLLAVTAAIVVFAGCGRAEFAFQDASTFGQTNPPTVCAPGTTPGTTTNGLVGSIKYLTAAEASADRPGKIDDVLTRGHDAGVKLILNDLSVPTVKFTQGFYDPTTGAALRTASGDVLVEWFALDLYSDFMLSDTDSDGYYQFALLADDGAVVNMNETQTVTGTTLVNNDGEHSTEMGCSTKAIYLKKNEPLPIHVKYYEGPRTRIALTLIWRKVRHASSATDAYCGLSGDGVFWDSNVVPSAPTSKFNDLLARGWKIPSTKNFVLPAGAGTNTCI
jgi:hypothetical protein